MPDQPNKPIPPVPPVGAQSPQQLQQQQNQAQQNRKDAAEKLQQDAQKAADKSFRRTTHRALGKGSLCLFQYLFMKHDPYPMALVTSIYTDGKVAGLNLHYLTFRYVKFLLTQYCGKTGLSYQNIKGDRYIVNSFRTYKKEGIRNLKMIDCDYLVTILGRIRSFNPNEVQAIREEVQRQLGRVVNKPNDKSAESLFPKKYKEYGLGKQSQDGRRNPLNTTPIEEPPPNG